MMQADWSLIGVRFALYLSIAGSFGLAAFGLYGLKVEERQTAITFRPWLLAGAGSAILLSLCSIVLMASDMAGVPAWPVDHDAIDALLTGTAVGLAWKLRVAALALAGVTASFSSRTLRLALVTAASGGALATLAWTGHGAMDEGGIGWLHLIADILHLLAAGVWVGALLALMLLVTRPLHQVDATHLALSYRALRGFGTTGTLIVATIVVTGVVNGWLLIGPANIMALGKSLYGQILLAKLALFAAMLAFASLNRFRLTPAFERSIAAADHRAALAALRRSLAAEAACATIILALVAWLGTLEPPTSAM